MRFFLAGGIAKATFTSPDGNEVLLRILLPSQLIIEPGFPVDERYSFSAVSLTKVHTCLISYATLGRLVRQNPEFAAGMIREMSNLYIHTQRRFMSLVLKKNPGRLAEALLFFADEVFRADDYELILTRLELGQMTRMAEESVVRMLKEFESRGLVKVNCTKVRLLDRKGLAFIAETGEYPAR